MNKKRAKKLLLDNLYKNPDKTTKRMFILGFSEGTIIKKYCTVRNCIDYVKNETTEGLKLINLVRKYYEKYDQPI